MNFDQKKQFVSPQHGGLFISQMVKTVDLITVDNENLYAKKVSKITI